MAEVYSLSKARRREPSPRFEFPESWLRVSALFGLDTPPTFTLFYLQRSKTGTRVFIKGGRLTINLSAIVGCHPPNFKEARIWMAACADRYGWQITETKQRI